MYEQYMDKGQEFLCSSCEYGTVIWKLKVHKSTERGY